MRHGHAPRRATSTLVQGGVGSGVGVEVRVGSLLFAVLFAPAVGLDLTVKWLQTSSGASDFLVGLLTWTKYTIAVLDAILYVVFVVNMAWRFVNELRWSNTNHV
jgi:hypothetical protein